MVDERRTVLYNKVVTSYHKAKIERGTLARELEPSRVEAPRSRSWREDLRVARAQCAESEAGRAAAAKLKVADGELTRLRQLEKNHLAELASLRTAEKEKVDDLSRWLTEVESSGLRFRRSGLPGNAGCGLGGRWRCARVQGRATGEGSSESFTMEDHMSSLAARVEPITKFGWELRKAAEELVPMLWPGKRRARHLQPHLFDRAGAGKLHRLEGSARVLARHGAVFRPLLVQRGGPGAARVSASRRGGGLGRQKAARLARASAIADFVDKRVFIADPNPHSDEEEELEDEGVEMDSPPPAVDPAVPPPAGA
ncbi:hypothetical protein QYE76_034060 [Lolium multiflorum]|uniref:Uncharacterized protein n=1 Tax=Lolium multiflorum TaxID=4521 RepID=A0AAD8QXA6_LOLMU|nr:hypothetical protein QYE76_034060 [Lolium multiflorum]